MLVDMDASSTVMFAQAARALAGAARRRKMVAPSFRCPPRLVGVDRSVRRRSGGAVVSVRVRGRPFFAVIADMIEGFVLVNALTAPAADRARAEMWDVLLAELAIDATPVGMACVGNVA